MMKKGFTLVELLIVVTILVTLLGVGLASFNSFNRRERLKQAALTLKSNLRFAQTKSISVEKPTSGCTEFVGMTVRFTQNSYAVTHECSPEGDVGDADTVTLVGMSFSPVPSDFTFVSRSNSLSPSETQTITLINGTETYVLTVAANGSVSEGGFQ
jgi:prepilin-type N-terminal cleavage/methylation domain-containing protein